MGDDKPLKSSFELAMERLRKKDHDDGVEESHPLSEEQKAEIARLRQEAKAKLAEREILHRKDLAAAGGDPAKIEKLEENYRVDRSRIESRLETAIEKVRRGG